MGGDWRGQLEEGWGVHARQLVRRAVVGAETDKWRIWVPRPQHGRKACKTRKSTTRPELASSQGLGSHWIKIGYKTREEETPKEQMVPFSCGHVYMGSTDLG